MRSFNWDAIQEAKDFDVPKPGGYVAVIHSVQDNERKEYLSIDWDFVDGPYRGANRATYDRAGFWPTRLIRSYKEKALGFFKAFKTCLEQSNPGYTFQEQLLNNMVGKRIGVVLGEEEYIKNDGSIGRRLYVAQTRTVKAIQEGDYKVPALKKLPSSTSAYTPSSTFSLPNGDGGFTELNDLNGEELPF